MHSDHMAEDDGNHHLDVTGGFVRFPIENCIKSQWLKVDGRRGVDDCLRVYRAIGRGTTVLWYWTQCQWKEKKGCDLPRKVPFLLHFQFFAKHHSDWLTVVTCAQCRISNCSKWKTKVRGSSTLSKDGKMSTISPWVSNLSLAIPPSPPLDHAVACRLVTRARCRRRWTSRRSCCPSTLVVACSFAPRSRSPARTTPTRPSLDPWSVIDWLIDSFVDSSIDWFIDWLIHWLMDLLIYRLIADGHIVDRLFVHKLRAHAHEERSGRGGRQGKNKSIVDEVRTHLWWSG